MCPALNISNLPPMLAGESGASPLAHNRLA